MIKRLKELRKKATPGKWEVATDFNEPDGCCIGELGRSVIDKTIYIFSPDWACHELADAQDDAALIVETVNNLDKLIAVCEAAKELKFVINMKYLDLQLGEMGLLKFIGNLDKALAALEEE